MAAELAEAHGLAPASRASMLAALERMREFIGFEDRPNTSTFPPGEQL